MPTDEKVKKIEKKDAVPKVDNLEATNFIVVAMDNAIGVTAANEREAVKLAMTKTGNSGKYLVVDADFVEVLAAWQRVELKKDSTDSLFPE